ncbi:uncharacterized protein GLRG_00962 [Colletotrichum graminicola M1.001]|uniref:Uncharacterized protein n=1 Tax=Colletotrichum graminicola (strain M1.001 / M2 / FGSC 10212) TaxID=645133 RepID=E3Q551_COLGM|nr:uncharacterized protein GLRG_00962 [Colletotrichum graminicola M1.001]EFQ25818.1 hypothetical protein GLRG_00962 [Colletotrichum graminicola M1.001]
MLRSGHTAHPEPGISLPAKTFISDLNKQVLISPTMPPFPVLVPIENDMDLVELILALDRPWPSPPMEGATSDGLGRFEYLVRSTPSLLAQRLMPWNVERLAAVAPPRPRARPPVKTIRQPVK